MAYPHLLIREAIAFHGSGHRAGESWRCSGTPRSSSLANPLLTPNPAKAPWYFLGLQELLHYFPPLVAGIIIPTLVVIALDRHPLFPCQHPGPAALVRGIGNARCGSFWP